MSLSVSKVRPGTFLFGKETFGNENENVTDFDGKPWPELYKVLLKVKQEQEIWSEN